MDGIPIKDQLDLSGIGAVFIADPLLPTSARLEIKERCGDAVEFHDYTGYFSNLGGRLSLTELLSTIHGPVIIDVDGQQRSYEDGTAALRSLTDKYEVKEIVGQTMKIKLAKSRGIDKEEALKAAYAAVAGDEPPPHLWCRKQRPDMITGVHHFSLIASSEDSVAFYSRLGFKEYKRIERKFDTVVLRNGHGMGLEIYIDPSHPPRTRPEPLGPRHLSLRVDKIDETVEALGVEAGPIMTDWVDVRFCFIADPDGWPVQLHK